MQDECVQYVGPYGAIPLAYAALHVEVCHKQTACNKCLGREHRFFLLWETGARHRLGLIQVLESLFWHFLDYTTMLKQLNSLLTYPKAIKEPFSQVNIIVLHPVPWSLRCIKHMKQELIDILWCSQWPINFYSVGLNLAVFMPEKSAKFCKNN